MSISLYSQLYANTNSKNNLFNNYSGEMVKELHGKHLGTSHIGGML